ncbi:hypothetical protein CLOM_g10172 [Closterium sp. NIES-68]|nr:hypothetical protein CLOM_g10172 [Closterium sp. NIES-68]
MGNAERSGKSIGRIKRPAEAKAGVEGMASAIAQPQRHRDIAAQQHRETGVQQHRDSAARRQESPELNQKEGRGGGARGVEAHKGPACGERPAGRVGPEDDVEQPFEGELKEWGAIVVRVSYSDIPWLFAFPRSIPDAQVERTHAAGAAVST